MEKTIEQQELEKSGYAWIEAFTGYSEEARKAWTHFLEFCINDVDGGGYTKEDHELLVYTLINEHEQHTRKAQETMRRQLRAQFTP